MVMELFKSKGRIVMNYEFVYEEDFLITPVQSCDSRLGRYQTTSRVMEIFLKIPNRIDPGIYQYEKLLRGERSVSTSPYRPPISVTMP